VSDIGVLVMAYGGPDRIEDVEPYLLDVRGGRPTPPAMVEEVAARYRRIGGRSPILDQTRAQASALEAALAKAGVAWRAYVGMRHWHPYIRDTLAEMERDGIRRAVAVAMAPHYSRMSIGEYVRALEEAGSSIRLRTIERWGELPGFLDALAGRVRAAVDRFPEGLRDRVPVLFTAHSLPERILDWGDPYRDELLATVRGVMARLGDRPHDFAFQSAAMTSEPWLGPDAGEVVDRWAREGRGHVVVAPVGFLTEHVEILFDLDLELRERAESRGLVFERIAMAGTAPEMIRALAERVLQEAAAAGWT
jgi:protoporphyrin/coproporphyrin ferrochelatase